jgi:hypothetical protein
LRCDLIERSVQSKASATLRRNRELKLRHERQIEQQSGQNNKSNSNDQKHDLLSATIALKLRIGLAYPLVITAFISSRRAPILNRAWNTVRVLITDGSHDPYGDENNVRNWFQGE